jgi:hypothetical protein
MLDPNVPFRVSSGLDARLDLGVATTCSQGGVVGVTSAGGVKPGGVGGGDAVDVEIVGTGGRGAAGGEVGDVPG